MRTERAVASTPCEVVAFDIVALGAGSVVVVDSFPLTGGVERLGLRHCFTSVVVLRCG